MKITSSKLVRIAPGVLVAFLGFTLLSLSGSAVPAPLPTAGGQVHGFVVVEMREFGTAIPPIRLPNAHVFLELLPSGTVVASSRVTTNPHGYFIIPSQPIGRYQICVEADGFVPMCDKLFISIARETVVLNHFLVISPRQPGAIWGGVRSKDGKVCYQENQEFGTLVTTQVSLLESGKRVAGPVTVNSMGYYVLPLVPGPGNYVLTGTCASAVGSRTISVAAPDLFGAHPFDLTLQNSSPLVVSLIPMLSGKPKRRANPGDTLQVQATAVDPDGDRLHYKWDADTPGFASVDSNTITWKLPTLPAINFLSVQVTDGKGGFAYARIAVRTGLGGVLFGGNVLDRISKNPVAGATVNVNGASTMTNAGGGFLLSVQEAERYVINVTKPGYALLSQVFYDTATGLSLPIDRVRRTTIDPNQGGRAFFEGKNSSAWVIIAPKSLIDGKGNKVTGPVHVDLLAYDLAQNNAIPGDLSAKDSSGRDVRMQSYGAVDVEVTDGGGQSLRLAPGAAAQLLITVDPAHVGTAPPRIPFLTYDAKRGYWIQEGQATRVGNQYRANIRHFSQFNADTVFTNTACIRMTVFSGLDPNIWAPAFPFKLHVSIPPPAGTVNHNDFPVTESINGLFRLPPNTPVTLEIHPNSGPDAILNTITVNSGGAISNSFNGFPPFDYGACNGFDPASPFSTPPGGNGPVVLYVKLPAHSGQYLTFFPGPGNATETTNYWKNPNVGALDSSGTPTASRGTFNAWKTTNGFNTNPNTLVPGEAEAVYFNNHDLQLGRDMHCVMNGPKAACYVSNYGSSAFGGPQGDPTTALNDAITNRGTAALASVAMEYDPAKGANAVQFFAYHNDLPNFDGTLFPNPALDSEGKKFLPQMCMTCHGGSYDSTNHIAVGSSFLPFDVFSFLYDQIHGYSLANQEENFRQLNNIVKQTNPNSKNPNNPIGALIDALYQTCGGVSTAGCSAVDVPYIPPPPAPGWTISQTTKDLYTNVTRQYCRTCHTAQSSALDWTSYAQWDPTNPTGFSNLIKSIACTPPNLMPQAEVPYKEFWLSTDPHGPALLGSDLSFTGGCPP